MYSKKTKIKGMFKSTLLLILMLSFLVSCVSCTGRPDGNHSSDLSGEIISSTQETSDISTENGSSSNANDESTDIPSVDTSSISSESSNDLSEYASSENSVDVSSEEPSSDDPSTEPSSEDKSSEDESSITDVSTLNPYLGTDIKPAEGKVIAFTFDDGPSYTNSTNKILDKLEELGMSATFFVVGERVSASTAPTIKRMLDLGCDLGNHSYNHPNFNSMSASAVQKQIADTNSRLIKHVGTAATLIRPPYGNITTKQMETLNTPIICWDIDSLDWSLLNTQKIYDQVMKKVHSGGIVLMHDIYNTTAEAFCLLADELVKQGYTLVTISELLGTDKLMCTTKKYGFSW